MADVDALARTLLEEAKRFLEKAGDQSTSDGQQPFLHAALVLGFCSFEVHINSIAEDFLEATDLDLLERSILAERECRLEKGRFVLTGSLKMYRLEDRIEFLYGRFSKTPLNKQTAWWTQLQAGLNARNNLVHAKESTTLNKEAVERALTAILDTLDDMYRKLYRRPYPLHKRGLTSNLTF